MDSLKAFFLREAYKETQNLGDRLAKIEPLIDWNAFTPIQKDLYDNQGPQGGRPNVDPVVMVKLLVLQQWYSLSDPELERQATDRLSRDEPGRPKYPEFSWDVVQRYLDWHEDE